MIDCRLNSCWEYEDLLFTHIKDSIWLKQLNAIPIIYISHRPGEMN